MESVVLDDANYKQTKTLCNHFRDILGAIHALICVFIFKSIY